VSSCSPTSAVQSGVGTTIGQCEPTRIVEGFTLDVCRDAPGMCATIEPTRGEGLAGLLSLVPEDSLLAKVIACISHLAGFVGKRVPAASRAALWPVLFYTNAAEAQAQYSTAANQYDAYCRLYQAIRALFREDPLNTRCALLDTLNKIDCPPPGVDEPAATYAARIQPSLYNLAGLLVQYALDCICEALLPPCPPAPCDNRLILACVTVKDDQIVRICNFSCRHYVGAFPSTYYWLSLVPIIPLIGYLVTLLCCRPDLVRAQSPLVNDFATLLDTFDPTGTARAAVFAGNFALPRVYADKVQAILDRLNLTQFAQMIHPQGINLAVWVNQPADVAGRSLSAAGLTVTTHVVASREEIATLGNLAAAPFAQPGQGVTLYTIGNQVVGYGPAATHDDVQAIRDEVAALRAEVAALRAAGPPERHD
jgi:hypothetical protein